MSLKNNFLIIILLLFLISCSKQYTFNRFQSKSEVLKKVLTTNKTICELKRKGVFFYEDRFNRVKFKGLLIKDCKDNFKLTVLGAFNQPALIVSGNKESFQIVKSTTQDTEQYLGLFNKDNIKTILTILNYPLILPDDTFNMVVKEESFEFYRDNKLIKVNKDYKVVGVELNNLVLSYEYTEKLTKLEAYDKKFIMKVSFF